MGIHTVIDVSKMSQESKGEFFGGTICFGIPLFMFNGLCHGAIFLEMWGRKSCKRQLVATKSQGLSLIIMFPIQIAMLSHAQCYIHLKFMKSPWFRHFCLLEPSIYSDYPQDIPWFSQQNRYIMGKKYIFPWYPQDIPRYPMIFPTKILHFPFRHGFPGGFPLSLPMRWDEAIVTSGRCWKIASIYQVMGEVLMGKP